MIGPMCAGQTSGRGAVRQGRRGRTTREGLAAADLRDPGVGGIDRLWRDIRDDRLARSRATATALARKTPIRGTVARTARTLWTLTPPELYVVQIERPGLTGDTYRRWLVDLRGAALLPDA